MVEQSIRHEEQESFKSIKDGGVLSIGGTVFSTMGKLALAIGTSGLLLFVFASFEAFIGVGAIYSGAIAICAGLSSMMLGNKLSYGYWVEGLLSA